MIPRVGEPVLASRRYRLRPGAYAILRRGDNLLLTFQAAPEPELQLPGGGIDPGESPGRALRREVREETGWSIDGLRRLGAYRRFRYMPEYDLWAEKLCHVFLARPALRHGPPTELGHAAVWLPAAEALRLIPNPGERLFLRRFLG